MRPSDLVEVALALVPEGPGRPAQARLRRAVSTAYYAVFHALARNAADMLAGRAGYSRGDPAWFRVNRAIDHRTAANQCGDERQGRRAMADFPPDLRSVANIFLELQKRRRLADYALDARFDKAAVLANIEDARQALNLIASAPEPDRRAFAAHVLFRERR